MLTAYKNYNNKKLEIKNYENFYLNKKEHFSVTHFQS